MQYIKLDIRGNVVSSVLAHDLHEAALAFAYSRGYELESYWPSEVHENAVCIELGAPVQRDPADCSSCALDSSAPARYPY